MKRILGIVLILAGAGLASWVLGPGRTVHDRSEGSVARETRSVLLVTLDTTRADRLGPWGAKDVETPSLSGLAERGVVFDRAYSVAPITLVAHSSILTGLYPFEHGVRNNGLHYLGDDVETLAETLADDDYRTAAFVSAAVLERRYGLDQGFEIYDDDLSTGRTRHPRAVADRPAEAVVDSAAGWLDGLDPDERYFAWVHLYDPHAPYEPPSPFRERYRGRPYDGEIAHMDAQIGRLLAHPRIDDETVVLVVGDHGESFGEHRERSHAILAYDSTLHIPWILQVPGGPAGLRIEEPVSQVDLLPTVLDLLGEEPRGAGRSLVPLLEGEPGFGSRGLYAETFLPHYTYGWAKLRVLRNGAWKYIDSPSPELYELELDPKELSNLIEQQPGAAADRRLELDELLAASVNPDREAKLALDMDSIERLRSLGYLATGTSQSSTDNKQRPNPRDVIVTHLDLERARSLASDRLYSAAVEALDRALERDPENLAALVDKADYLSAVGRLDEAREVMRRCLELDPDYPPLHLQLASIEAGLGNLEGAMGLVDTALELEPAYLEATRLRAILLFRQGRTEQAERVIGTALAEHPDDADVMTLHAEIVDIPNGRIPEAESNLVKALDRDPFQLAARKLLAALYERSGKTSEAIDLYLEGIERHARDPLLRARAGILLAGSSDPRAEQHLREAIRLSNAPRPAAHLALATWLWDRGRADEARSELQRILDPQTGADANSRALAHYYLGDLAAAHRELDQLLESNPQRTEVLINLAAVAASQRDWSRCEAYSRQALELDERLVEAWTNLGISLDEQEQRPEARQALERALELDPSYWPARNSLALTLLGDREYERARELLEQILVQVPDQPEVHWELGSLYAGSLDDPQRAAEHFQKFVQLAPQDPRAEQALDYLQRVAPPS